MNIVQFLVFFILVPILYLFIILMDVSLIIRARTLANRWRNLASVFSGFLLSAIIILLDQNFGTNLPGSISRFNSLWLAALIFGVLGFLSMLVTTLLIKRGVIPFVILFQIVGIVVSGYFLFMSPEREILAIAFAGFIVGIITFFIILPTRIADILRKAPSSEFDSYEPPDYSGDYDNWRF